MSYLPNPYFEDREHGIELYLGDCKDVLWNLPNHFAQAIITDPPYQYMQGTFSTLKNDVKFDGGRDYITKIQDEDLAEGFDFEMLEIMEAKLNPVNMQFFCNKNQLYDYLKWIREKDYGFQLLEWHKPNPMPTPGVGLLYLFDTEFIIHIFKSLKLKKKQAVFTYFIHNVNKTGYDHPTIKPDKIVLELIRQTTEENDIVIDPYLGSGTTAICCKKLGRRCIGIEIKEKYIKIAIERLKETEANQFQSNMLDELQ
jgi:DNA modification methylase